ncbi:MAG TPA: type II toxin-antitoxin system VapC family toxin [Acidisarcina sp.]
MSKVVLDASALLALLNEEPGAERLTDELLSNAVASTVSLAEVQSKLVSSGAAADESWKFISTLVSEVIPFTAEQARIAGDLVLQTRAAGLSLGDRACLALGATLNVPVYTTDRAWKGLKLGVRVHLLR